MLLPRRWAPRISRPWRPLSGRRLPRPRLPSRRDGRPSQKREMKEYTEHPNVKRPDFTSKLQLLKKKNFKGWLMRFRRLTIVGIALLGSISAGRPLDIAPSPKLPLGFIPTCTSFLHHPLPLSISSRPLLWRRLCPNKNQEWKAGARPPRLSQISTRTLPLRTMAMSSSSSCSSSSPASKLPLGPGVVIFSTPGCKFCAKAKARLRILGVPFTDVDVADDAELRASVKDAAGGRTSVPQIFVAGEHIGGCDDMLAEEESGKLAARLDRAGVIVDASSARGANDGGDEVVGIELGPVGGVLNFHAMEDQGGRGGGGGETRGVDEVVESLQRRVLAMFDEFLTPDGKAVDFKRMRGSKVR